MQGMMTMHKKVIYMLTIAVFFAATSELVIAGILNVLADELNVSVALAGQLITVYSLAFAIGTPIVTALTIRMKRKRLLLSAMLAFIIGSLVSFVDAGFAPLLAGRVLLGVSSGVLLVAAFGAAAKIAPPEKIGSAIGTIILGFSSALILGVPLGIALTNLFSWRIIFLILGAGSAVILYGMSRWLPEIEGDAHVSFRKQIGVLSNPVIVFMLLFVLLREAGNNTMFSYISTFLATIMHRSASEIGLIMLTIGIAGAIGSRVGGMAVDKWGSVPVIVAGAIMNISALMLIPTAIHSFPLSIGLMSLWILSMFVMGPTIQAFFIEKAPQSSGLVISLNISVTQVGLAAGAGIGGMAVSYNETVLYNPWVASALLSLALAAAIVSIRRGRVAVGRLVKSGRA